MVRLLLLFPLLLGVISVRAETPPKTIRVATYNVALYRREVGQLADHLSRGDNWKARGIAEVIQRVRPDILLLCEIDYDPEGNAPGLLAQLYLEASQAEGLEPIKYPYQFVAPVNTGVPAGIDLDGDGRSNGPNDAYGYGHYPGQYGMAILSRFPIDEEASRTFQKLLWNELPGARQPIDPGSGDSFYTPQAWKKMRLPSKSFWDVVVNIPGGHGLHLLCSHPTPPVFDGPEDRNGCRNADEIRLIKDYISSNNEGYFTDDAGQSGTLAEGEAFIVLGDLNSDPIDGQGISTAIQELLASPRLATDPAPTAQGGVELSEEHASLHAAIKGDPSRHTANFTGEGHSNLRIDYALPSKNLGVKGSGIFWPRASEPGAKAAEASDHRLVWVDIEAQ